MSQQRHPAGTSVGGQFAPGQASEVEAELAEAPEFDSLRDRSLAFNAEKRVQGRLMRQAIVAIRQEYPTVRSASFDWNEHGGLSFSSIDDDEGTEIDTIFEGVEDFELDGDYDFVSREFPTVVSQDGDTLTIDCSVDAPIEPRLLDAPPSSAMHEATGGRLWSPVLDDRGTGYRRDQIRVGDQTVEIAGNERQTAEIGFYEEQAVQDGDFFSSMPASPVTERA